jgi:hypothetical protein
MNQKWTFEDIKNMVETSFPLYQEYEASKGPRDDGLVPWRLCYRDRQVLSVFCEDEPNGESLLMCKGRSNLSISDSIVFIGTCLAALHCIC